MLSRFNFKALRDKQLGGPAMSAVGMLVSRRDFFGMIGAAVPSFARRSTPFQWQQNDRRVNFFVGDRACWVIDADRFSGSPELSVRSEAKRIDISLRNAFFPGTDLAASFQCRLSLEAAGWQMSLTMDSGIALDAPFIEWLLGDVPAAGSWHAAPIQFSRHLEVRFHGSPSVEFRPGWTFDFIGDVAVSLPGFPSPLPSNQACISLGDGEQLAGVPLVRRTVLKLSRGRADWNVGLGTASEDGWRLHADRNLFDALMVEAGDTGQQQIHTALWSQATDNSARLQFRPAGHLKDESGKTFSLDLNAPRLAVTLGEEPRSSALLADFTSQKKWLHGRGFSLLAGGGPKAMPFELLQRAGEKATLQATPELSGLGIATEDDVCSTLKFDDRRGIQLTWANIVQPLERGLAFLHLTPWEHRLRIDLTHSVLSVLRTSDLLKLDFHFENLHLSTWFGARLEPVDRRNPAKQPIITVIFPPQNIAEQAFLEQPRHFELKDLTLPGQNLTWDQKRAYEPDLPATQGGATKPQEPPAWPVDARIAESSRLVFQIPATIEHIPFRLSSLLDWTHWDLKVHPVALSAEDATALLNTSGSGTIPDIPDSDPTGYTSIEMPYRLMISPPKSSTWTHSPNPVNHNTSFTELWHTRLATLAVTQRTDHKADEREADENDAAHRTIRAIWSPDYAKADGAWPPHANVPPFRMSLDSRDRFEIVHLTSDYKIGKQPDCDSPVQRNFVPGAVQVDQMMLSSLGGWLKSHANWEPPLITSVHKPLTVEEWRHSAGMGRDHYVKVVYKGYLMPFGHRASLVKITERKFDPIGNGSTGWGAFLRQRFYIVVKEVQKQFPAYGMTPDVARAFAYDMVEAVTLVTPTLEDPTGEGGSQSQFWPRIGPTTPFKFQFRLHKGDVVTECSVPMLFVDNSVAYDPVLSGAARDQYNRGHETDRDDQGNLLPARQVVPFNGQKISFAAENQSGDTQYNVNWIRFQVTFPAMTTDMQFQCLYGKGQPAFYPQQNRMGLNPEAVRRISGMDQDVVVQFTSRYIASGFDPVQNLGEVFFEILNKDTLAPGSLNLSFSGGQNGTQSGGVVTPNVGIVGFSRKNGSVGGGGRTTGNTARVNANSVVRATSTSLVDKVASGEFDPLDFFGGALSGAKILGAVSLWDIVKPLAAGALSNLDQAPKMLDQTLFPLIQDAVKLETDIVALLTSLPDIVQKQLGAEIQTVCDNLAKVQASPKDLFIQAAFIRSLTQVGDKVRSVLNNPSSLLDPALQQLTQWRAQLESLVIGKVSQVFQPWKDTYELFLSGIEQTVTGWVLTGLDYKEAIQTYQTEIQRRIAALRSQMKVLVSLEQNPTKLAQVLAAQIPALGQLDDMRKRFLVLIQLANKQAAADLTRLRTALTGVQKWTLATAAAQAELDVQNFESQTQIWIASIQDASNLSMAQQLVRQASGAMRSAILSAAQLGAAELETIHKQLLTSLQQLQTMVFNLPAGTQALAATPHPQQPLLTLFNQVAREFSVVRQAMSAGNLETILADLLPLLPDSVQADLTDLRANLGNLRNRINTAGADVQNRLVGYYLQLFELWQQYQDPFKLAVDVFGLSADDINNLRALQTRYQAIITLAQGLQTGLNSLKADYNSLLQTLPTLAQVLLSALTDPAKAAIDNAVAAGEDQLLAAEQQAISALSDLYLDILRRVARPLDNLAELVNAKNSIEALVKQFGLPQSVTLSYQWAPVIKDFDPIFIANAGGNNEGALTINAAVTTYFDGSPPQFAIDGKLTNFTVNLIGSPQFIGIVFDHLNFSSHSGSKPDCQVQIKRVDLAEALSFVKKLESLLSPKDGPFLELNFNGILAGFRFAIPTITVGAFSLQHLRLIVAVNLPFSGDPMRCEFGVSERDNPFLLSVGIFGGGGFFHMRLGLDGVELLEGALEFGVVAEISIGVATGGGYIMAGIYFSVSKTEAQVCGFVHANGHLDVLGLVSMDIDAYVQICYVKKDGKTYAEGEARLIIHIEILFFSADIELHAHYEFAGSDSSSSSGGGANPALAAGRGRVPESSAAPQIAANSDPVRTLKPPPAPGDYCDLGTRADWNRYRRAFAW